MSGQGPQAFGRDTGTRSARRPVIGVMGAGEGASSHALALAEALGAAITGQGWCLLSGGRAVGVMAAASRGARSLPGHCVIGVLPDAPGRGADACGEGGASSVAAELDVALFTGMGQARNVINVLSSDVVVVCGGGGPGTASEAALALKAARPLVLLAAPEPWPAFFLSLSPGVRLAEDVAACCREIHSLLQER